jgi:hypothetical protein
MMLSKWVRSVNVILGSVVTLVVALSVAVTAFADEAIGALPAGWQDNAAGVAVAVVTVLGAAAAAIRRLTEVPPSARGILPPE